MSFLLPDNLRGSEMSLSAESTFLLAGRPTVGCHVCALCYLRPGAWPSAVYNKLFSCLQNIPAPRVKSLPSLRRDNSNVLSPSKSNTR